MSSHSYSQDCPICQSKDSLMICSNNRPYPSDSGECITCGFTYWTEKGYMDLDEVNEMREDRGLVPLDKLKEITDGG